MLKDTQTPLLKALILHKNPIGNDLAEYLHEEVKAIGNVTISESLVEANQIIQNKQTDIVYLFSDCFPQHHITSFVKQISRFPSEIIVTNVHKHSNLPTYHLLPVTIHSRAHKIQKMEEILRFVSNRLDVKKLILEIGDTSYDYLMPIQDKIIIHNQEGVEIMHIKDILYIQAWGKFCHIFMMDGTKHMYTKSLKELVLVFGDNPLLRSHRSFLININHIKSIIKSNEVILHSGIKLPLARRKRNQFILALNGIEKPRVPFVTDYS